jgi:[protein-PII] uridylyltransferase
VVDELGMTIVDARIVPLQNDYSLDTYIFMELDKRIEIDESRISKVRRMLTRILTARDSHVAAVTRAIPRQARMFKTRTTIDFLRVSRQGQNVMELVAADRPGLLSKVGQVFIEQGIDIHTAKIMTIGEKAEDVFYITDEHGTPLDEAAQEKLRQRLIEKLDKK